MDRVLDLAQLWQKTFLNAPIGIAIAIPTGEFFMANEAFCKMLGYSETELKSLRWQDITHPDDILQEILFVFDLVTGNKESFQISKRFKIKNGSYSNALTMVAAIRNSDKQLAYLLSHTIDTSEILMLRELAKDALQLTPELKDDVLQALAGDHQFYLKYEPIYNLQTDKQSGSEGLIRWNHPTKGLVYPLEWIPACENSDLMPKLCSYVVSQGTKDVIAQNLGRLKHTKSWVSVNISPTSLQSEMFFEVLTDIAMVGDMPTVYLEIIERLPVNPKYLKRIQNLGFGIFLDDFGQGHSSLIQLLQLLKELDPKYLKIKLDGWFSREIEKESTQVLMGQFIDVLHQLKLEVIVECIENKNQLEIWKRLKADYGQGWFWKD